MVKVHDRAAPATSAGVIKQRSVPRAAAPPRPAPTRRRLLAYRGPARLEMDDATWWSVLAGFGASFALIATLRPELLPLAGALLLLLVGLLLTSPAYLLLDATVVGAVVLVAITLANRDVQWLPTLELVMIGALVLSCARQRERRGVAEKIGGVDEADTVLIDLRDRLRARTAIPPLPRDWHLDVELRQAGGDRFGGDFVLAATPEPGRLDVVVVDVSGKGRTAGGRALLLAGAFAALLDSVPQDRFLPMANQHVLRHGDDDGFATAVHFSLDLLTGIFVISAAGHPPAAQHHAGSGRWTLLEPQQGLPLGILPDAAYPVTAGHLAPGDALMLYTDGLVEAEGVDVSRGIDRLLGAAEAVLLRGDAGSAQRLVDAIGGTGDDRGLVLLHRH
ncbi:PP2C family protein-serine/threonine phosphatase [Spongisporangium articulatum]|uniref:PP2C family protein-serine/threonine phosphatase n=1 Tax=Spongisporangium articulatum TaxID=3362603 RepID=A0ABW8AKJ8_9ACTN